MIVKENNHLPDWSLYSCKWTISSVIAFLGEKVIGRQMFTAYTLKFVLSHS